MPFTFSHPAIILPFLKLRSESICASALIVGSMMPDFQYFILMKLDGRFSHTIPGIFLFNLPVGLVVLTVFHVLVKKQLIENLPVYFQSRLQALKDFDFLRYTKNHFIGMLLCLVVGTTSHIVWDGFTHFDGIFAKHFPILFRPVYVSMFPELPLYRYLQHISTGVGGIIVWYVFHRLPRQQVNEQIDLRFWTVLTFFFTATLIVRVSFGVEYYGDTITILISSGMAGLLAASLVSRLIWNKT